MSRREYFTPSNEEWERTYQVVVDALARAEDPHAADVKRQVVETLKDMKLARMAEHVTKDREWRRVREFVEKTKKGEISARRNNLIGLHPKANQKGREAQARTVDSKFWPVKRESTKRKRGTVSLNAGVERFMADEEEMYYENGMDDLERQALKVGKKREKNINVMRLNKMRRLGGGSELAAPEGSAEAALELDGEIVRFEEPFHSEAVVAAVVPAKANVTGSKGFANVTVCKVALTSNVAIRPGSDPYCVEILWRRRKALNLKDIHLFPFLDNMKPDGDDEDQRVKTWKAQKDRNDRYLHQVRELTGLGASEFTSITDDGSSAESTLKLRFPHRLDMVVENWLVYEDGNTKSVTIPLQYVSKASLTEV